MALGIADGRIRRSSGWSYLRRGPGNDYGPGATAGLSGGRAAVAMQQVSRVETTLRVAQVHPTRPG